MAKKKSRKQTGGFVKVIKNKAYFKRYQVKFRRRREGKTDYQARKRLIAQDKNKYNSPKYRLIVRFTNRDIVCQIAYAQIKGDVILASAYSHELPKYGIKVGLTNYAAAYATGLLVGRRVLQKLGLAEKYPGKEVLDGEDYLVEELDDGPRPFYALLDSGLARTSSGSKIFAAMKGACDAGVEVPHSPTRFIGYDAESEELNAETFRKHIFGGHVSEYMSLLKEESPERYQKQFSKYIEASVGPDDIESMYENAHKQIREDPTFVPTKKNDSSKKSYKTPKLTLEQRKAGVQERIAAFHAQKES